MARPALRARIANIDCRQLALEATRRAVEAYSGEIQLLFGAPFRMTAGDSGEIDDATLRKTPTCRLLRALAEYGVHGGEPTVEFEPTLDKLLPVLRKLHMLGFLPSANAEGIGAKPVADLGALLLDIDTFAFDSELGAALVAARARTLLARDEPLTTTQLAVLAGLDKVTVGNAIRAGALKAQRRFRDQTQAKRNPYIVKPADARRFLQEREATAEPDAAD